MRRQALLLAVALLLTAALHAQAPAIRAWWIPHDPQITSYILRRGTSDDVTVCVELPHRVLGCVTVKDLRDMTRKVAAADKRRDH